MTISEELAALEYDFLQKTDDLMAIRAIMGSTRKVQSLLSCMALTGMSPDEYRVKANEQFALFKATSGRLILDHPKVQSDNKALIVSLKPIEVKKQKTTRELMAADPLWAYKKSNIDEAMAVGRMVAGAIHLIETPIEKLVGAVCGTTIGSKICKKAHDIGKKAGDATGVNGAFEKIHKNKGDALSAVLEEQYLIPKERSRQFADDAFTLITKGPFLFNGAAPLKIIAQLKHAKPLTFTKASLKELNALPKEINKHALEVLQVVQKGGMHPSCKSVNKFFNGESVFEIVHNSKQGAYRTFYKIENKEIRVLGSFKKEGSGSYTPRQHIERAKKRLFIREKS